MEYVCGAHSWYKHLPLLPPGVPFLFFVDPSAGSDRVVAPDGHLVRRERVDPNERFHYNWMLTAEYRRRFGHLAYDSGAAPTFVVGFRAGPRVYAEYPVFVAKDLTARIPDEVARAGTAEVTGTVHEHTGSFLLDRGSQLLGSGRSWPEETGGQTTQRAILALAERHARTWARYERFSKRTSGRSGATRRTVARRRRPRMSDPVTSNGLIRRTAEEVGTPGHGPTTLT